MHVHLCVVLWLFSSPVSFSSSFRCSSSGPSRCLPPSSTRGSSPKTCATSAWGPWPLQISEGSHASSSHEASLEPIYMRREELGKHNVHTHFPKDRNCEICKRTKITRAPCRRRKGEAVPRADNCESRNNHRYAVVVQDLATQWIQAYPCKNKTSQETQRSLQKFLEPERKPKVIYTDNFLEFGKACEDLSWNHCTSTPHRSETNGIAERAVRRVKEGTSAELLQSGLNESWWADSMECYTYLRNVTDLLSDGKDAL